MLNNDLLHDDVLRRHAASLLGLLPKLLLWPRSCCSFLHSTAPVVCCCLTRWLPFLTPKLTCGLLVPVLDQGLVEMHFGINSQPSSLAIYTTLAELCWLLSDSLRLIYHRVLPLSRLLHFKCAAAGAGCSRAADTELLRKRALRCARCGDQRARVALFSRAFVLCDVVRVLVPVLVVVLHERALQERRMQGKRWPFFFESLQCSKLHWQDPR